MASGINGGSAVKLRNLLASSIGAAMIGQTPAGTVQQSQSFATLEMTGQILDGDPARMAAHTTALQSLLNEGYHVVIRSGIVVIDSIDITTAGAGLTVYAPASILCGTPTVENEPAITLTGANTFVEIAEIDLDETDRPGVQIEGENCRAIGRSVNVSSSATSSNSVSGLIVGAAAVNAYFEWDDEFAVNNGNSNGSTPRAVTINLGATGTKYGSIRKQNGDGAGFVPACKSAEVIGTGDIWCKAISDNAIYNLGANLKIKDVHYDGDEEGIVNEGKIWGGKFYAYGRCVQPVALDGRNFATDGIRPWLECEEIILATDASFAKSIGAIFGVRSSSVECEGFRIGRISGKAFMGTKLCDFSAGLTQFVEVGSVDLELHVDKAQATPGFSDFMNFSNCRQYKLKNWNVQIVDDGSGGASPLTSADHFAATMPTTLTGECLWENIRVTISQVDKKTPAAADFRATNLKQQYVRCRGVEWENTGAVLRGREFGYNGGMPDSIDGTVKPTVGYWYKGEEYRYARRSSAPNFGRCTTTGGTGVFVITDL